jgi:hypothetical protein
MARAILVVQANPSNPEREDEFNRWYNETHLPDVLRVEGYIAAQRFRVVDGVPLAEGLPPPSHRYLAVYELDTDDLEAASQRLREQVLQGAIGISDSLDLQSVSVSFYRPVTERLKSEG